MRETKGDAIRVGALRVGPSVTANQKLPPSRGRRIWGTVGLAGAACLAFVLIAAAISYRANLSAAYEAELDALRAQQVPTTTEELREWYGSLPAETNGAVPLINALTVVAGIQPRESEKAFFEDSFRWPEGPLAADLQTALHALLARRAAPLEQFIGALSNGREQFRFQLMRVREYNNQFWGWRQTARMIQAHAILAAEAGDGVEAARHLQALLSMAQALRDEVLVDGQLLRFETLHFFLEGMEQVLGRCNLSPGHLAGLGSAIQSIELREGLRRVLVGERVLLLNYEDWRMAYQGGEDISFLQTFRGELGARLGFLDLMRRAQQVFEQEGPEALDRWEALNQEHIAQLYLERRLFHPATWLTMELRLEAARAALAIEAHRQKSGTLPQALEDIAGFEAQEDPFTGDSLRYRHVGEGFAVYSVGIDAVDDGGSTTVFPLLVLPGSLPAALDAGVSVKRLHAAA